MKKVCLKIEGMHCDGCAKRLTKALENKEEISSAKVSYENKEAEIEYENLTLEEINKIIEDLGFESLGEIV